MGDHIRTGVGATGVGAIAACAALLAFGCATASATVRYAAPGGTAAPAECTSPDPAAPRCTIFNAGQGPGVVSSDEVVIEPGTYTDVLDPTGDLGPTGALDPVALKVHGAAGLPRPVLTLSNPGSVAIQVGSELSHLEIRSTVRNAGVYSASSDTVIEGVIVRMGGSGGTACRIVNGTLRDSVCLTSGTGSRAVGADGGGVTVPKIRNVTAIASGSGTTTAIGFTTIAGSIGATVKSSIAKAPNGYDVSAAEAAGGNVSITIDHSNYWTVWDDLGAAPINDNGGQQTGTPALAADGYHQLPTSTATIDLGAVDASSGDGDIDGQFRQLDGTADIGADDIGHPTVLTFDCSPSTLTLDAGASSCHVLVTHVGPNSGGPGGTVAFSGSQGLGSFSAPSCILDPVGIGFSQGECTVAYSPSALGSGTHQLTGAYAPTDRFHESSEGGTALTVVPGPAFAGDPAPAVRKKCKKAKKKKRKLKRGKCLKRKKKRPRRKR
jgi:hypothetical protein